MTSDLMYPARFKTHDMKAIGTTDVADTVFSTLSFPYGTSDEFLMPIVLHYTVEKEGESGDAANIFYLQSSITIEASMNVGTERIYKSEIGFGDGIMQCTYRVSCETPGELVVAIQEANMEGGIGIYSINSISLIVPSFMT